MVYFVLRYYEIRKFGAIFLNFASEMTKLPLLVDARLSESNLKNKKHPSDHSTNV